LWRDGDGGSDIRQNPTAQQIEFGATVRMRSFAAILPQEKL
jgi:hypothetical protein